MIGLLNKLSYNETIIRPIILNKLKLIYKYVKKKYPKVITDGRPQTFMGCYSRNFSDSVKLGYDNGLPYFSIYKRRGTFKSLHIYIEEYHSSTHKWHKRELFIGHKLATMGHCVLFCKVHKKDVFVLIDDYLKGSHALVKKEVNDLLQNRIIDHSFTLNSPKPPTKPPTNQWVTEKQLHVSLISKLRNELGDDDVIIDGKAQGNLNNIFHKLSNDIGYTPGIFDIILFSKRGVIFIELKIHQNTLSENQKIFVKNLSAEMKGCPLMAIEFNGTNGSIDDLINLIKNHRSLK